MAAEPDLPDETSDSSDTPSEPNLITAPMVETPATAPVQPPVQTAVLPMFTPLKVMLNEELSSQDSVLGDPFTVTVLEDVVSKGTVVIPAGAIGHGEVTFATTRGGFGKPGILGISLRTLELDDDLFLLDGRYREEGKNKNGTVAATWLAVGVFSGFIKGRAGFIEQGRELRAKTGEDIRFVIGQDAIAPPAPELLQSEIAAVEEIAEPLEDAAEFEADAAGSDARTPEQTQSDMPERDDPDADANASPTSSTGV